MTGVDDDSGGDPGDGSRGGSDGEGAAEIHRQQRHEYVIPQHTLLHRVPLPCGAGKPPFPYTPPDESNLLHLVLVLLHYLR